MSSDNNTFMTDLHDASIAQLLEAVIAKAPSTDLLREVDQGLRDRLLAATGFVSGVHLRAEANVAAREWSELELEGYRAKNDSSAAYCRAFLLGIWLHIGASAPGKWVPSGAAACAEDERLDEADAADEPVSGQDLGLGHARTDDPNGPLRGHRQTRMQRRACGADHLAQHLRAYLVPSSKSVHFPEQRQTSRAMISQRWPKSAFAIMRSICAANAYTTALAQFERFVAVTPPDQGVFSTARWMLNWNYDLRVELPDAEDESLTRVVLGVKHRQYQTDNMYSPYWSYKPRLGAEKGDGEQPLYQRDLVRNLRAKPWFEPEFSSIKECLGNGKLRFEGASGRGSKRF